MKKLSIAAIEYGLNSENSEIRTYTLENCLKRRYNTNIPVETIERWMQSANCRLRFMSMYACYGREDIPFDIISHGMKDDDNWVRRAAFDAYEWLMLNR